MDTTATEIPASAARRGNGRAAGHDGHGRSVAGLFSDLWRETTTLVQEEAELAKADMSEKVTQAVRAGGTVAVGGAMAFAGFLLLLMAAAIALARVLPPELAPWLAPLIVGGVVLLIGLIMLSSGRRKLEAGNLEPTRSMASLRRDRSLIKEHMQ